MKLSTCIHQFFEQYLPQIKGFGPNTIKGYRDVFSIFLPFARDALDTPINSLQVEQITPELIVNFLGHLETERGNGARTRNHRLAAIKSLAKMILYMHPDKRDVAIRILNIPQKRYHRNIIGFLYQEEILAVLDSVDLNSAQGFRNYTILNLLFDSGARASEVAALDLDFFDSQNKTLAILGKGGRFRMITLWPKTTDLLHQYIKKYRITPHALYKNRLFLNQRGKEFTRHGIYRLCRKYLEKVLPSKRLKDLNPAHSFRHSCAVNMLLAGHPISDIKNRLGHESIKSTMIYLHLDLGHRQQIQKKFIAYTQSLLNQDDKIDELLDWENKEEILNWLDSL
ncbi:MAG: tyrosine-type recombinase/integrase [Thermodesulfobacteriota bacterium]|nr:tyrosine-type recombinase/integrase [Thermodesulfobacteriota bacterium]